jgi:hypothetical protein
MDPTTAKVGLVRRKRLGHMLQKGRVALRRKTLTFSLSCLVVTGHSRRPGDHQVGWDCLYVVV